MNKDLIYLCIKGDDVTGPYGSFLTRADLANTKCKQVHLWEKKPSSWGIALVGVGIPMLLTIQATAPEERVTWPIYQAVGDFTVLLVLGMIVFGIYLIVNRRKLNKNIPDKIIEAAKNGSNITVLILNDQEWVDESTNRLKSLAQPDSGDWEFFSLEKMISRIR